jgi:hypothetical protein
MNTQRVRTNAGSSLIGLAILGLTGSAAASSHREAPAISFDPAADNTDLYAWVSPGDHDKLYIVANWIPLEEPAGGPNFHQFDDDVRYEVHIARGPDSLDDAVSYYILFHTDRPERVAKEAIAGNEELFNGIQFFSQIASKPPQQIYSVYKVEHDQVSVLVQNAPVAPANIGPRTDAVVYKPGSGKYDDAFSASFIRDLRGGGRVFAGPRDDGFYVDLGGIFDLANITSGRKRPTDGVAGYNTHTIALEIPTKHLTGTGDDVEQGASDEQTLGIWSASSRRKVTIRRHGEALAFGPWVQVSRLGLPLINEAVIGLQDKDKYNRTHPRDDLANFAPYFLHPVIVRNAAAVGIYDELGVDSATVEALKHGPDGQGRLDIVQAINLTNFPAQNAHSIQTIGDVLRVDMGIDSAFPNGRPLIGGEQADQEQADVTDVLLSLLLSAGTLPVSDNVSHNDKDFLGEFPYLASPHQGFDEGHGKPAR